MTSALLDMPTPTPTRPAVPAGIDRIVLTGFMGSGKTTVGALLAQLLNWRFLDLDREIERRESLHGRPPRSVPQIISESGEAHFRRLESTTLAALLGQRRAVIALGGGAPEALGNRLLLEQTPHTAVIYLAAPLQTLLDRCAQDAASPNTTFRPILADAHARFHLRHPLYTRIAAHTIQTAPLAPKATASAILEALQSTT